MSKRVEEYIENYTSRCSNEVGSAIYREIHHLEPEYSPWLTPDQARKAVEIAREEIIEKAQDWIADTFKYDGSNDFNGGSNDAMSMLLDDFTEYIKQAMKESNGG